SWALPCSGWPPSRTVTACAPHTSARASWWRCGNARNPDRRASALGRRASVTRRASNRARYQRGDRKVTVTDRPELEGLGNYKFGWADPDIAGASARRGLSEEVVRDISRLKNEPEWMLNLRLKALRLFEKKPMPTWGADLSDIDFDNIKYFVRS